MLTAYFDESYNHRTEKNPDDPLIYTVACWLSTAQKWLLFVKKWRFVLNKAGIEHFHMTDFEARKREFETWSDSKRISVLRELHQVINDHVIFGCSSSLNCGDYDELIGSTPILQRYFGRDYYEFNVRVCIKDLNDWCDQRNDHDSILYVFANLQKQSSMLTSLFRDMTSSDALKKQYRTTGQWTQGSMREVVQLQAADIVAYELNKRAVNSAGKGPKFIRKSLENLHLSKIWRPRYFDRDELSKWTISAFTGLRPNSTASRYKL